MTAIYGRKNVRRFLRRVRSTDMKAYLKTGADMGMYGVIVDPVKIEAAKLQHVIDLFIAKNRTPKG